MKLNTLKEFTMINEATSNLNMNIPKDIIKMNRLFKKAGHELYIVGGAIRDALMGKDPKDWDLATDATPEKIKSILKDYKFKEIGEQFAIVFVITPNDEYEIATFREEGYRDSNFSNFVEYILQTKPSDYEKRLNLLYNLSNKK